MKRRYKILWVIFLFLSIGWTVLTVWVEKQGERKIARFGNNTKAFAKALILYDPDPIYDLDEQVCLSFGKGLAEKNMDVTVVSVKAAEDIPMDSIDLFVFCANTYNWRPDWAITNFIEGGVRLENKKVVAITLGSGSTEESRAHFEKVLHTKKVNLIDSRSLWLMRPNDEARMKESNIEVAKSIAYEWGRKTGEKIKR